MFKLTRDKAYLKKKNSSNYFLCWGDRFKNIKIRRNLSMNQIIFLTIHFMSSTLGFDDKYYTGAFKKTRSVDENWKY